MIWQPRLEGPTLFLKPLEEADFERLFHVASDPKIWEQHPESTRYQRDVFRKFFDSGLQCKGGLLIIERSSGAILGSSRFTDHDPMHRSVEIGYTFLARSHWGGETNRELKTLMLSHAFLHVDWVYFVVGDRNLRSQRAMEKIGGVRIKDHTGLPLSGDLSRHVIYVIRRGEFAPPHPAVGKEVEKLRQ